MKRDFSNDNISKVKQYLKSAYNSTDNDYRKTYANQSVPDEHTNLKYNTLSVGSDANSHIQSIRDRLDTALSVISTFYSGIDNTSLQIYAKANNIIGILDEINTSMEKIDDVLKGNNKSKYSGNAITPDDIRKAGIDEAKCDSFKLNYYKDFLDSSDAVNKYIEEMKALKSKGELLSPEDIVKLKAVYNWYLKNGNNLSADDLRRFVDVFELLGNDDLTDKMLDGFMKNDDAVKLYLADMNDLKNKDGSLSPSDADKTYRIYNWYVKNRFDSHENEYVNKMQKQTLQNCVDAYELLNPKAKEITDNFFEKAYEDSDPEVAKNILKIKYGIYTSDPMYRDLILGYLPNMKLNPLPPKSNDVSCSNARDENNNKQAILNLDLHRVDPDNLCSFFHECGHGIDYLSQTESDGKYSDAFQKSLESDAIKRVVEDLKAYNSSLPSSEQLDDKEIRNLVFYIFNRNENPNIVKNPGNTSIYPPYLTNKQIKAYQDLRKIYGYYEYSYSDCNRTSNPSQKGWYHGQSRNGIVDDVFGGMTNSKLAGMGHAYSVDEKSVADFEDYDAFRKSVINDSYYHSGDLTGTEFYAEVFEYRALNRDLSTTRKVFDKSVDMFDDAAKDAYGKLKNN
ncbi:MAG: hypothetical protein J6U23_12180 [Clostridiales bacterium]|nr:hypothetical protein [Clostridiales bacterium]